MKTLRVSDDVHRELTRLLGEMMTQSGRTQTYSDVIELLVSRTVYLPAETLAAVKALATSDEQWTPETFAEFIQEAVAEKLNRHSNGSELKSS